MNSTALHLAKLRGAMGRPFPTWQSGGAVWGIPAVVSTSVGDRIVLIEGADLVVAEGAVEVSTSEEASLQMDSAPADPVVAATVLVSLWQVGCVGVRALQFVSWREARAASTAYISGVTY